MIVSISWIVANIIPFAPSTPGQIAEPGCHDLEVARPTPHIQLIVGELAGAVVTPAPALPRWVKRDGGGLVGYYAAGGSYAPWYCPDTGATWTVGEGVGGCCTASCAYFVTGCDGAGGFSQEGQAKTCASGGTCGTLSIFPSLGANNYVPWIGCGATHGVSIYQVSPVVTSPTPPPPATNTVTQVATQPGTTIVVTQTQQQTNTITPAVTSASPISTTTIHPAAVSSSSSSPVPVPVKKSNTGAIVGGAVGGGALLGLLALAGLCICFRRRKRRNDDSIHADGPAIVQGPDTVAYNAVPSQYYQAAEAKLPSSTMSSPVAYHYPSGTPSELSGGSPSPHNYYAGAPLPGVQELSGPAVHELSGPGAQELSGTTMAPQPYYPPPGQPMMHMHYQTYQNQPYQ